MYLEETVIIIKIYGDGSRYLGMLDSCGLLRWPIINQIPKTGYTVLIRWARKNDRAQNIARIFSRWQNILLPTKTRLKPVSPTSPWRSQDEKKGVKKERKEKKANSPVLFRIFSLRTRAYAIRTTRSNLLVAVFEIIPASAPDPIAF